MTTPNDLFDLSDGVALVTGASGWLGREMTLALAGAGATVIAVARNADRLADLVAARDGRIHAASCDVRDREAWPALVREVGATHGRLDVLVNNAHVGRGGSLRTSTEEQFDEAWDLAIKATWRGIEAARPALVAAREAGGAPSIVNVSSMYGLVAPDLSVYATEEGRNPPFYGAAKAAVTQLTRYAAAELGPAGIRVNTLTPGPFPQHPEQMDPAFLGELASRTLLGRVGDAGDIRTAVLFLASRHSAFVTGSNVVVDGGWTAR